MKLSEKWLREWVNPAINTEELCHQLTMAGLEIEGCQPVAPQFEHIVVGQILKISAHPNAEKLTVCEVDVDKEKLTIVCGAKNVREQAKVPVALIGAVLPNGMAIKQAELRGVASFGMLCSAAELGLQETADGLMILADDAPIGENIRDYLQLDDVILEINLTPNRGDCLSILGVARDTAAMNKLPLPQAKKINIAPVIDDRIDVTLQNSEACPRYIGRVIKNINNQAVTPIWMQEKLRRSDIRSISPVVDILNYVMLELGQPMHAFDLEKLQGNIQVRFAKDKEKLTLLNQQNVELDVNTLVIADEKAALAIAGVMGGLDSSVTSLTHDIFLESAYFNPIVLANIARRYAVQTDSSYRFERGVDFNLPAQAIERATELLLEIVGGKSGPVTDVTSQKDLPQLNKIQLSLIKINQKLGIDLTAQEVKMILESLGMHVNEVAKETWEIIAPSSRFDIQIAEDVVEEIARIYGYNQIPAKMLTLEKPAFLASGNAINEKRIKTFFQDQGYHEAITYSFIAQKEQALIDPQEKICELVNPISSDMAVMRTSLWAGLLNVYKFNLNRQQPRIRLFEVGRRFRQINQQLEQQMVVSGLVSGSRMPEQWSAKNEKVDFFDVKGDLEKWFAFLNVNVQFKPGQHAALHPGQTAEIILNDKVIGHVGLLHPSIAHELDIKHAVYLFELELEAILQQQLPQFTEISKFPAIRRDFAFIVTKEVMAEDLLSEARTIMHEWLSDCTLFDVFSGEGIETNKKSIALGLTLQHPSRTLKDDEVNSLTDQFVEKLKTQYGAILRQA